MTEKIETRPKPELKACFLIFQNKIRDHRDQNFNLRYY